MHPTTTAPTRPIDVIETLNRIALGRPVEGPALDAARAEYGLAPRGEMWPDFRVWARPEPDGWGYGMPAWTLRPEDIEDAPPPAPPRDAEPVADFAGWVEMQVRHYQQLGTAAADLVAETLHELLAEIGVVEARDPAQFRDRIDAYRMDRDRELIARGEAVGYERGVRDTDDYHRPLPL